MTAQILLILLLSTLTAALLPDVQATPSVVFGGEVLGPDDVSLICPEGLAYKTAPARPDTPENITLWLLTQPSIEEQPAIVSCLEGCVNDEGAPPGTDRAALTIECMTTDLMGGCGLEEEGAEPITVQFYKLTEGVNLELVSGLSAQDLVANQPLPSASTSASFVSVTAFIHIDSTVHLDVASKTVKLTDDRLARVDVLQGEKVEHHVGDELRLEFGVDIPASCLTQPSPITSPTTSPTIQGNGTSSTEFGPFPPGEAIYFWTLRCESIAIDAPTQVPTPAPSLPPTSYPTTMEGVPAEGVPTAQPTSTSEGTGTGGSTSPPPPDILPSLAGAKFYSSVLQVPPTAFLPLFANSSDVGQKISCSAMAWFKASNTTSGDLEVFGVSAATEVVLQKSNPVAVIKGGDVVPLLEKAAVSFDGSSSCDPNAQITCDANQGNLGEINTWLPAPLTYTWSCQDFDGVNCSDDLTFNQPTFEIPDGTLLPELSPYKVVLSVSSTLAGPPMASSVKTVTVNVVANPSGNVCPRPLISIASLPPRVNANFGGGVSIRGAVDYFDLSATEVKVEWTIVTLNDQGATVLLPLSTLPGYSSLSNLNGFGARPELFLPTSLLTFGSSYRLRLTALTVCNKDFPELNPYAEITFSINTPPSINQFLVTPSTGSAVITPFKLEALDILDVDGDYPIEFAFEYAYVGDELGPEDRVRASLSNFSPSPFLNTVLQVPPRKTGGRIKIFVVARDSLGAESAPVSREILVNRPFPDNIQSLDEAFNVQAVLNSAVLAGGNAESVLRTIQAIASVCNEAGAATQNSVLSQWNRDARTTMIGESLKLRKVLAESNLLTPRVLAMEASALKNSLAVPFEVSLASQQTAVVLINEILEDTTAQLNILSKGESAEQLLPADLIQSSLQSISLLAEAALEVLAQTSAEDGDDDGTVEIPNVNNVTELVLREACEATNAIFFSGHRHDWAALF